MPGGRKERKARAFSRSNVLVSYLRSFRSGPQRFSGEQKESIGRRKIGEENPAAQNEIREIFRNTARIFPNFSNVRFETIILASIDPTWTVYSKE